MKDDMAKLVAATAAAEAEAAEAEIAEAAAAAAAEAAAAAAATAAAPPAEQSASAPVDLTLPAVAAPPVASTAPAALVAQMERADSVEAVNVSPNQPCLVRNSGTGDSICNPNLNVAEPVEEEARIASPPPEPRCTPPLRSPTSNIPPVDENIISFEMGMQVLCIFYYLLASQIELVK